MAPKDGFFGAKSLRSPAKTTGQPRVSCGARKFTMGHLGKFSWVGSSRFLTPSCEILVGLLDWLNHGAISERYFTRI